MLIRFTVSNFLSFDEEQELSLKAGKARKYSERLYIKRKLKLVKCEALFGCNASGKSNLVAALQFVQNTVENGFPRGFSNRLKPSRFEIEFICRDKRFCFGFSAILNSGNIIEEWLYELTASGIKKELYSRNVEEESFIIGSYFKKKTAIAKLVNYGEDPVIMKIFFLP